MTHANYKEKFLEDARLIILREMIAEDDAIAVKNMDLRLQGFGINRSIEWIEQQYIHLENVGAITIGRAGSVVWGQLTQLGRQHLARKITLVGVDRPSEPVI
jgi:hypothetical protein